MFLFLQIVPQSCQHSQLYYHHQRRLNCRTLLCEDPPFSKKELAAIFVLLLTLLLLWLNFRTLCQEKLALDIIQQQMLAPEHRQILVQTWQDVSTALNRTLSNEKDIYVFLYNESLLGWYRHGKSIIPWWNRICLAIYSPSNSFSKTLRNDFTIQLKRLGYFVNFDGEKIFVKQNQGNANVGVDIFIINTGNFDQDLTNLILPLQEDTFEGHPVNVPQEAVLMLEKMFDLQTCETRQRVEMNPAKMTLSCWFVKERFGGFTNVEFWEDLNRYRDCEEGRQYNDLSLCQFKPRMTPAQRQMLINALNVTLQIFRKFEDTTYFASSGTLIGVYRHNGSFIPWDDDVDLAICPLKPSRNYEYYVDVVKRELKNFHGYTHILIESHKHIKIFGNLSSNSYAIPGSRWRWPFVDIDVYNAEFVDDEIYSMSYLGSDLLASKLLPPRSENFEGFMINVPKNLEEHFGKYEYGTYDLGECQSPPFSHRFEQRYSFAYRAVKRCKQLEQVFGYKFYHI